MGGRIELPVCPKCGIDSGERVWTRTDPIKCAIRCMTCGYTTPLYNSTGAATKRWVKERE